MHTAIYPDRNSATREPVRPFANSAAGTSSRTGSLAPTLEGRTFGPARNPDRLVSPRSPVTATCPIAFPAEAGRTGPARLSCDAADRWKQTIHRQPAARRSRPGNLSCGQKNTGPAPSAEDLFPSCLPGPRPRLRSGASIRSEDRRAGRRSPITLSAGSVQVHPPFRGR